MSSIVTNTTIRLPCPLYPVKGLKGSIYRDGDRARAQAEAPGTHYAQVGTTGKAWQGSDPDFGHPGGW